MEWVGALSDWAVALAGSPWVFLAMYAFATIDGFFPPVPSESVVIALAALSLSTGEPELWLVGLVAALGAFSGDQIAYSIGHRIPTRRLRLFQRGRARRALHWAERALAERGGSFIIAARYVPVGRVAVNMTAGTLDYPRTRFSVFAGIAAVTWSVYSVLLGVGAGVLFSDNPWLAVLAGVVGGILLGLLLDPLISRITRGRGPGAPAPAAAPDQVDAD